MKKTCLASLALAGPSRANKASTLLVTGKVL